MPDFSEKSLVEDHIINRLAADGWRFIPADELERTGYDEPLLLPNLIRSIEKINIGYAISEEDINKVINELKLTGTGIEGAKRILNFYKQGVPVKLEKDKVIRYVNLFDYQDLRNNDFIVTRQAIYDGRERIRTDIMLYVNGIPLVDIECKDPTGISESWVNAHKQIKDYEQIVPELFKYVQIGVAAESQAHYFPIASWQEEVLTHQWQAPDLDSIDATCAMQAPETLLDIICNFLFYREEKGTPTKVITRYMQYRAANKMVARVLDNLAGRKTRDKGLVWHWQGSGKTLTMIFAANKLYYLSRLENPSIFFIVDRIEIEDQLYDEFYALDIVAPEIIGSIGELKKVISHDDYRGKRGVFITLIHKFRPEELKELQQELAAVSERRETISSRRNVIAFIDEGHRSQYGLLAGQMKAILQGAFFFALTGTPISKRGRDTFLDFSYPPGEPYLDRYFITDSTRDGFTVKIVYQPRLEKEVHLKKDLLQGFLDVELEELPEGTRTEVEEKVKERLNRIELFLENPERIAVIADDIAKHFQENVDGRFKAIVVAASRHACVLYKRELDKHLPADYSKVVMTTGEREEDPLIASYVAEARESYGQRDMDDVRKGAVEKFKTAEMPKILIVTEMLLTGFDAPMLQTMYLDKPLKEHRLLQAVARTNRPYRDVKEAGLVIDYVSILKEFKKALEMYSEEDIAGALYGYDSLKEEFKNLIDEILNLLEGVPYDYERATLLKAIEVITANEAREKAFTEKYRHLRKVFELLGSSEVKVEHFEQYKWLSAIYTYYMKTVSQRPAYELEAAKYYDKTIKYVHKSVEVAALDEELPAIAFDADYLQRLEERVKSKEERAANILFTLNRLVLVEKHRNPVYESLVEKVEKLLQLWREKTKDYRLIYKNAAAIVQEANELSARQKELAFSDMEYALLLVLETRLGETDALVEKTKKLSKSLEPHMFTGWINQATARKSVEREVRRFAMGIKRDYRLSMKDMDELYENLIESVNNYGAA